MHSLLCSGAQDRDLRPPTRSGTPYGMPPPRVAAANFSFILSWLFFKESLGRVTQCAERISNKLAKAIKETFAELRYMLQVFIIYFE